MKIPKSLTGKTLTQAVLTTIFFFSLSFSAFAGSAVSLSGDNVNIRTGPSKNKPVYMQLSKGYPLKVVKRQGDWVKVIDYEGDSGWVDASYIEKGYTYIVNAKKKINMRSRPTKNSDRIAEVYRGVILTKLSLSKSGKWAKVKSEDGVVGWIYKPLLWP